MNPMSDLVFLVHYLASHSRGNLRNASCGAQSFPSLSFDCFVLCSKAGDNNIAQPLVDFFNSSYALVNGCQKPNAAGMLELELEC